jgi:LPXTG-motif cell wall-anchored protein
MKRLWHLPTLLASFMVSLIGLKSLNLFMGPDTGDAIAMILLGILGMHLLAFVIGLLLTSRKVWR